MEGKVVGWVVVWEGDVQGDTHRTRQAAQRMAARWNKTERSSNEPWFQVAAVVIPAAKHRGKGKGKGR